MLFSPLPQNKKITSQKDKYILDFLVQPCLSLKKDGTNIRYRSNKNWFNKDHISVF